MSRPFPSRSSAPSASFVRVNGKIRAREVRVIGVDGKQLGVISLAEALGLARTNAVDLVEIAPNATPPVCRLVDFGKFRYEQAKKDKESKKHQHANKVKEIQLSPKIDPHDLGVKLSHAIDFLCEEMKVKVVLKFRGREMAHTEYGFQLINKFIKEITPYGHADSTPRLTGKAINLMLSPLPRNKRAKNPRETADENYPEAAKEGANEPTEDEEDSESETPPTNDLNGEAKPA
ncbi:MAG: translation initiation factor [Pedosphaera sp.]|nr:translation initiation factor [Pedosphaera sp.]